ncbi:MAG: 1-acyl-sn-glycerol-3-phosphate acyltransferase [Paludibacteraceae bacterium]
MILPLIFAPNHLNALMDALSVHLILPKHKTAVFLAKADLFDSKLTAALMRFAKILPAYRKENGVENLQKNNNIFEQCVDVMRHGQAIGIMPEGGQGEEHRIRPLVKGVFRIAFEAQLQFGIVREVKIIPIGLDMGDLVKSGKHLIITIGKPINIRDYIEEYQANPSVTINITKQKLRQALSESTIDIASREYYRTIKFLSDIEGYNYVNKECEPNATYSKISFAGKKR